MNDWYRKSVTKLTPAWLRAGIATLCLLLAPPIEPTAAATPEWQPVSGIAAAAEQYLIKNRIGPAAKRTAVRAGALDVRLKLAYCDKPLEGFLRRGTVVKDRTIVGVRCAGTKPWKVYVPVNITVTARVLVAKQPLPRGHLVTADDLIAENRDVSRALKGYFTDPAQLVGKRVKSPLLPGRIITPSMLEADKFVRRGQTVTLTVLNNGIQIRMAGKALSDGALNQRIRVENLNSGRIVEGIIRSREHIEVLMAAPTAFFNAETKVSPKSADTRSSQQ